MDAILLQLQGLVSKVISARRLEMEKRNRANLLGLLVENEFNDANIRSILFDVVIFGSDITVSTTTAALCILHHPQHAHWLKVA